MQGKVWCRAGPEFGADEGKIMLITRALYGLKSSGAAFRSLLADHVWDIGFRPSQADNDVWLRPAVKPDGTRYYEYLLIYVDDVLGISHNPNMLNCIKKHFKLKGDKIEEPSLYLGANITKMVNEEGKECWAMGADDYCASAVQNVEKVLANKGLRLPSRCITPTVHGYRPELDATAELKADGIQWYQEMIGMLRWACEIGRVDILTEVAMMSQHMCLPRQGHLEQVLHIVGYLKSHKK